jgi:hypothetical protein
LFPRLVFIEIIEAQISLVHSSNTRLGLSPRSQPSRSLSDSLVLGAEAEAPRTLSCYLGHARPNAIKNGFTAEDFVYFGTAQLCFEKSTKALCDGRYWPTALLNLHVFIEWEIKTRGYSLGTATQRLIHAGHQISIKY